MFSTSVGFAATENDVTIYQKQKNQLVEVENKQRQILSALYQITKNMKKIVTEKSEISDKKMQLTEGILQLKPKIEELEKKNENQLNQLGYKIKQIYIFSGKNHFRTIFGNKNPQVLERQLKLLARLTHFDQKQAEQYRLNLKELNHKQQQLLVRIEKLKNTEILLTKKQERFNQEIHLKDQILRGIKKQKLFTLNKMKQIKSDFVQFNTEDSGVLDALFKPSFMEQMGGLTQPIQGQISQNFGVRRMSPTTALHHKGLFFSAPSDTHVVSVFEGKVAFKGQIPGYGETLIIDHGDHYYSVYAALSKSLVDLGQAVQAHQVIAQSGSSLMHKDAGLYFEIRHFSEPYDPSAWLKGTQL